MLVERQQHRFGEKVITEGDSSLATGFKLFRELDGVNGNFMFHQGFALFRWQQIHKDQ